MKGIWVLPVKDHLIFFATQSQVILLTWQSYGQLYVAQNF